MGIALVVLLGLIASNGSVENFSPLGPSVTAEYKTSLGLFGAMFAAFLGAFWAYDGWNNITSLGAEVRNAKPNTSAALTISTACVMLVYCVVNAAYIYVLPVDKMAR